jgi:hypothetical protein
MKNMKAPKPKTFVTDPEHPLYEKHLRERALENLIKKEMASIRAWDQDRIAQASLAKFQAELADKQREAEAAREQRRRDREEAFRKAGAERLKKSPRLRDTALIDAGVDEINARMAAVVNVTSPRRR